MCLPKKNMHKNAMLYRNWMAYVHEETCIGSPQLIHDQNSDTCNWHIFMTVAMPHVNNCSGTRNKL